MIKVLSIVAALALCIFVGSYLALAQQPATEQEPMTFFLTSAGSGNGADLGGLDGADAICQRLAATAGRGDATWRAYLSTQGQGAVNARDRIGQGPWHNANGGLIAQDVAQLHSLMHRVTARDALTEAGGVIPGSGFSPNKHDILTGSQLDGTRYPDGEDMTCGNWTSSGDGSAQVGHHDRMGRGDGVNSWNSEHASRGCSQEDLVGTGGAGLFYCFAID